jgi:hypothetical protein
MGVILDFLLSLKLIVPGQYKLQTIILRGRGQNISISEHTLFVNFIVDGVLKVVFVRSEDNGVGIYTKNTRELLFEKHLSMYKEDGLERLED